MNANYGSGNRLGETRPAVRLGKTKPIGTAAGRRWHGSGPRWPCRHGQDARATGTPNAMNRVWEPTHGRDAHATRTPDGVTANLPNKPELGQIGVSGGNRARTFRAKQSQFRPGLQEGQRLCRKGVMVNRTFDRARKNKANFPAWARRRGLREPPYQGHPPSRQEGSKPGGESAGAPVDVAPEGVRWADGRAGPGGPRQSHGRSLPGDADRGAASVGGPEGEGRLPGALGPYGGISMSSGAISRSVRDRIAMLTGRWKRLGPALPGLRYKRPSFHSTAGLWE